MLERFGLFLGEEFLRPRETTIVVRPMIIRRRDTCGLSADLSLSPTLDLGRFGDCLQRAASPCKVETCRLKAAAAWLW